MKWNLRVATVVLGATTSTSSFAYVAFSNFGPGDTFNPSDGWTIAGPNSGVASQVAAAQFTALASGSVSNIRIVLGNVDGPNVGEVTLYDDSGSDTIGQWHLRFWGPLREFGAGDIWILDNPFADIKLMAGEKYWIGCHYYDDESWHAWNDNSVGDVRRMGFSSDGGATYEYSDRLSGVFEVNIVPEPATLATFALGAAVVFCRRRR